MKIVIMCLLAGPLVLFGCKYGNIDYSTYDTLALYYITQLSKDSSLEFSELSQRKLAYIKGPQGSKPSYVPLELISEAEAWDYTIVKYWPNSDEIGIIMYIIGPKYKGEILNIRVGVTERKVDRVIKVIIMTAEMSGM